VRHPWVNTILLLLVPMALITGYLGLTNGHAGRAWILWLHAIAAYAILAVAVWKVAVVRRSLQRKPLGSPSRPAFLVMGYATAFALLSGVAWAWLGSVDIQGTSLMTLHAAAAAVVGLLFCWHIYESRAVFRVHRARDRRAFLRLAVAGASGVAMWQGGLLAMRLLQLPGTNRRFTGSYETGSFTGNFPGVIWLADDPEPQAQSDLRLRVHGHVANPLELSYPDLSNLPASTMSETIDCTGGWYSEQRWTGVAISELLDRTRPLSGAHSVTVTSVTGYNRRFSMAEARSALLALRVAGQLLTDEHGYPVRLVVPGHRGFDWVKWVTQITVNEAGDEWQSPLPV